ncbi:MAG: hypothetical protein HY221_02165 [Candidatus Sungbacteria bacterium]|uniref:Plasmid pRiA4b Orf3-like domain-containing protein n=1 Tax=Candidatus Sungiibacteriota bacterium TaxID=2750080 RepID=A0A932QZ20_9BACT|nr:hypothetical protein [Candidatus Sungbacteria bacterium]
MKSTGVLQIKITLVGSRPTIWRTLLIPSDYNFFALHVAIQDACNYMTKSEPFLNGTDRLRFAPA